MALTLEQFLDICERRAVYCEKLQAKELSRRHSREKFVLAYGIAAKLIRDVKGAALRLDATLELADDLGDAALEALDGDR